MPLECHGFALHKGGFCDALALRYGWSPKNLPVSCVCGRSNNIEHALSCPNGAFPTIRHNDIRDLTAELMSDVCHDVSTEPPLQPLSGESLSLRTANQDVGARLDIKDSGVLRLNLLFLMLEYLTLMPLQTVVIPIASMKLRSAVSMRRECERWNMVILVLLFFQLLEAWVPPLLWLTNAWPSSYPVSGNHRTVG